MRPPFPGRPTILINNAGGQFPSPAANISLKGWEAVIRNNLTGLFFLTQSVAKRFFIPENRGGRVVNITANVHRG
jgi:citronellol/citronellal dehydrogenase